MVAIGPAAIPALERYLTDATHGLWARVLTASALEQLAEGHPAAKPECVASLYRALEKFETNPPELNGTLVGTFMEFKVVEAAPLIERAFAAEKVDESVAGDWEDVQIEFSLLAHRTKPRKPNPLFAPLIGPRQTLEQLAVQEALAQVPDSIRAWNETVEAKRQLKDVKKVEKKKSNKKRKR